MPAQPVRPLLTRPPSARPPPRSAWRAPSRRPARPGAASVNLPPGRALRLRAGSPAAETATPKRRVRAWPLGASRPGGAGASAAGTLRLLRRSRDSARDVKRRAGQARRRARAALDRPPAVCAREGVAAGPAYCACSPGRRAPIRLARAVELEHLVDPAHRRPGAPDSDCREARPCGPSGFRPSPSWLTRPSGGQPTAHGHAAHPAARFAGSAGPLRGGLPELPASVRRRCSPLRLRPSVRFARPYLGRPGSHVPAIRRSMRRSLSAAERPPAGRGGTSARIPMRRRPPRLGSPPGPPLRGDPSNQSVSPGGEPIGPRRDWGGCGNPRTPGCPGNMARHRQGPIVPSQSRTAHRADS